MFPYPENQRQYLKYRARELYQVAERERVARTIRSRRRIRFYYRALAQFGSLLITYGWRLHIRYGELCEGHAHTSHPAHRNA